MRYFLLTLLILASIPLATAASFTAYTGDNITFEGTTYTIGVYTNNDPIVAAKTSVYTKALNGNDTDAIADAKDELIDAIAEAKLDDRLSVKTSTGTSAFIDYQTCEDINDLTFCFPALTYYEEDAKPLGDSKLDSVKIIKGGFLLPATLTITKSESKITASRSLSQSTIYEREPVTVTLTVANSGTAASGRVEITDSVPFTLTDGSNELIIGSLPASGTKQGTYTFEPQTEGVYTIYALTKGVTLANSTLTVKSPLLINVSINATLEDTDTPVTIYIKNNFDEAVTVNRVTVTSDLAWKTQLDADGKTIDGKQRQFDSFTLAPGANLTTTGTLLPIHSGTYTLTVFAEYTAVEKRTSNQKISWTAAERTLDGVASIDGKTFSLALTNNFVDTVEGLTLTFPDGASQSRSGIKADSSYTFTRSYAEALTEPLTVTLRYQLAGKSYSKTYTATPGNTVVEETPTETETPVAETPAEQTPSQETPPTEEAQPTTTTTETETVSDDRGLVKRILDFLSGLFS